MNIVLRSLRRPRARKVAVVGGGPAGLKAAITLADKGHAVTLFEPGKSSEAAS